MIDCEWSAQSSNTEWISSEKAPFRRCVWIRLFCYDRINKRGKKAITTCIASLSSQSQLGHTKKKLFNGLIYTDSWYKDKFTCVQDLQFFLSPEWPEPLSQKTDSPASVTILTTAQLIERFSIDYRKYIPIALVLHCYALWLAKKSSATYQPIRTNTKINRDLLARVFPRLEPATCIWALIGSLDCQRLL